MPGIGYLQEMAATRRRLETLIDEFRPDVLHAHSPVLNAVPALRAGRRHRVPVVYEVRAFWEDAAVDHGTTREGSARYRLSRMLETNVLARVDHVTTICEGLRRDIADRGIDAKRITVIPNAVDPGAFVDVPPDRELRARLGLDDRTVLGFAGSFYAYEGLDLLVEAFAMLAPARPTLRLLLVGGGPQEAALRALIDAKGLRASVLMTGRVAHEEMRRYYGLIDLLVYPRRRMRLTELVTPLKPLEAMAQGRVLIASDVGGHRELIDDGKTGFLFPADDVAALASTIVRVLDDAHDWPELRQRARRYVEEERNWKRSVERYVDVYRDVTARAAAPRGAAVRESAPR